VHILYIFVKMGAHASVVVDRLLWAKSLPCSSLRLLLVRLAAWFARKS